MTITISRRTTVLAALVCCGALAAMTRASWAQALGADLTGASRGVEVAGHQAAPAVLALAVVGVAASLATTLSSAWVRFVTGPVLILVGAGSAITALRVHADAPAASVSAVAEQTGVSGGGLEAEPTVWPVLAALVAALVLVSGVAVLVFGGRWPRRSKYQRDAAATASLPEDPTEDPAATWDALSRGDDPS